MTEFEWEQRTSREEAASLLRRIADSLDGDGKVELQQDGWELRVPVAEQVTLQIEVEVEDEETELEIELKWPTAGGGAEEPELRPGGDL